MKKTTNGKIFSNYVLVIISITVVLFFLSSFLITILNSEKIINDVKEKIPVVVFLKENISFKFYEVNEKTIVIIDCKKLKKGSQAYLNDSDLYVRVGPSSEKLSAKQALEFFNKLK